MDSIREQMELTNEISEAISNPLNMGIENDEEALKAELAELEAEKLDEVLMGANSVPQHAPAGKTMAAECKPTFDAQAPGTLLMALWKCSREETRRGERGRQGTSGVTSIPRNVMGFRGLDYPDCVPISSRRSRPSLRRLQRQTARCWRRICGHCICCIDNSYVLP